MSVVLSAFVVFTLGVWVLGRYLDSTVSNPIEALDAVLEHLLDP